MAEDQDLTSVANFLFEAGTLKHTARTGWWMAGVRQPETVAEHSWRTSLIASVIAKLEGADPARAAFLAVWHDTGETRTGDVNHLGKKYTEGEADPRDIVADQVAAFPEGLAQVVTEVIAEYEAKESPEAVCARDADKLECMLQGIEYRAQGYENAQRWIDNSRGRIVTKAGQALADAVLKTGSLDWLRAALGETQR
ncbi:HD domain-containing protein [Streptomyces sp. TRM72054]|uniref:HD domain-containing protein n=1 Tax=Streptomyces sp. TRM72054 TaxID=2870562 RepID=UPI001C8B4A4B|nr:HD domain-containing protein [Streptomyces sp. TRM72054]MBX9395677.1 HD domain-containing protein [Streptomyces sp. TRM72054]